MHRLLAICFLAIVGMGALAALASGVSGNAGVASAASPVIATSEGGAARPDEAEYDPSQTEITRNSGGQFNLTAQVNGQDAEFLIDTGADVVAITVEEALRMGIDVDPATFVPVSQTASGVGMGARVVIDSLSVGQTEMHNVEALVMDGLTTNLLGQSALRKLGKVELEGDRMVIRHL